ncbi:MAG: fascin domain-containing protein [Parashewanella sp.]
MRTQHKLPLLAIACLTINLPVWAQAIQQVPLMPLTSTNSHQQADTHSNFGLITSRHSNKTVLKPIGKTKANSAITETSYKPYLPKEGDIISLRVKNGQFVHNCNCTQDFLEATSNKKDQYSTFVVERAGKKTVALKAANKKYVRLLDNQSFSSLRADADQITPDASFIFIDLGDNKIAIQANNQRFLQADFGGGFLLRAIAREIDDEQTFTLE